MHKITLSAVLISLLPVSLCAEDALERMQVRISFGHKAVEKTTFPVQLIPGSPNLSVEAGAKTLSVGAGAVEALTAGINKSIKKTINPNRF